jgi:hypothetical protein
LSGKEQNMDVFLILFACLVAPFTPATNAPTSPSVAGLAQPPAQHVDVYDAQGNRIAWGRKSVDGRTDYFRPDGTRIGWSRTTAR